MLAGHPEHGAFLISTEVLDVSPDDLRHPGASEQQNRDERSGTGSLRALHRIGGVHERESLVRGEGRGAGVSGCTLGRARPVAGLLEICPR